MKSEYPVVIVGAGAAGIGAATRARELGVEALVIEASHRAGGRGLTEQLAPGVPWDLGCHWLHSGSINPLAAIARSRAIPYDLDEPIREFFFRGQWLGVQGRADYLAYATDQYEKILESHRQQRDVSVAELIDFDSQWLPYYAYWQSLMSSSDIDNFSALDLVHYRDTGEDWPLRNGYGALLVQLAAEVDIEFNCQLRRVDRRAEGVRLQTSRGELVAQAVVVTVSTGVLGAGDIEFLPALPASVQQAIHDLPLGLYNNFALLYDDNPFPQGAPQRIDYSDGGDVNFAFKLDVSGWPYVYCSVAGRVAEWLERQPMAASEQYVLQALADIFGNDIKSCFSRFRTSAWGGDPLVKGAFSASRPGCAHQRAVLASPIDETLVFAGEATSADSFCTAHGAWQSGCTAIESISASASLAAL